MTKKVVVLIAAVVALCAATFVASNYVQGLLNKRIAALDTQIAALDEKVAATFAKVGELAKTEAEGKAAADMAHADAVRRIEKIKALIPQQAQAMPMTEAVKTTQEIIQDSGVEQVEKGVMFTPSAFRLNLGILMSHSELSLALKDSQTEAGKLRFSLAAADGQIAGLQQVVKDKDAKIAATDEKHSLELKAARAVTMKKVGVAVALTAIVIELLHLIFGGN